MTSSAIAANPLNRLEKLLMPGPLSSAHQKYENDCSNCHKPFKKDIQNDKCINCHDHKNIKLDIEQKRGYHGRVPGIETKPCRDCHSDHLGRQSKLVLFNPNTFNHNQSDFRLIGKHTAAACKDCHAPDKAWHKAKNKCVDCHKEDDTHNGQLGKQCETCHASESWTRFIFDHDKTRFKLTGQHQNQTCIICHPDNRYRLNKPGCFDCHESNDIHKGLWGKKCNECHSTTAWSQARYDHDGKTKFKLKYSHITAACEACHKNNPYKNKTPLTCVRCHGDADIHKTLYGKKCHDCHTEKAWSKPVFNHNDTDYALKGKHKKASCAACHPGDLYKRKTPTKCYACHLQHDVHNGSQGKSCKKCHNEKGWLDNINFDHNLSSFPLLGIHQTLACEECHGSNSFDKAEVACISCHNNIDPHKAAQGNRCQQCHFPADWKAWKFDHDKQTDYPLKDAHAKIGCDRCHIPRGKENLHPGKECVDCHLDDDMHDGAFGNLCERCHNTKDFRQVSVQ